MTLTVEKKLKMTTTMTMQRKLQEVRKLSANAKIALKLDLPKFN